MNNELRGMLITAGSILAAAVVSGLRLKPYIDAEVTYTPASFMIYPALLALAIAAPLVFLLRKIQGDKDVDLGPLTFSDQPASASPARPARSGIISLVTKRKLSARTPLVAFWCVLYIVIAVTFFPYEGPEGPDLGSEPAPQEESGSRLNQPIHLPYATDTPTETTAL